MFQKFDYTGGRTFVVGDIHGEFELLEKELTKVDFDLEEGDKLFSVGDLVDRGPQSHLAIDYLNESWFFAVRGNHEQMVIDAGGTHWHVANGGEWFNKLEPEVKALFVREFQQLPLMIEFVSPSGRRIGICHASFPPTVQNGNTFETDWNEAEKWCAKTDWRFDENEILWNRYQIGRAKKHYPRLHKVGPNALREFNIANIDHVYFGHTPIKEPFTIGNCTWLDTGAFATGNLTVVEVK